MFFAQKKTQTLKQPLLSFSRGLYIMFLSTVTRQSYVSVSLWVLESTMVCPPNRKLTAEGCAFVLLVNQNKQMFLYSEAPALALASLAISRNN